MKRHACKDGKLRIGDVIIIRAAYQVARSVSNPTNSMRLKVGQVACIVGFWPEGYQAAKVLAAEVLIDGERFYVSHCLVANGHAELVCRSHHA